MSLSSNFNKIAFTSAFPIDKIGFEDSATYSQPNFATGTQTITNPLGYKCFITLAWSVDNINFYPALAYTAASAPYTANAKVSDTQITFYLDNFSGSTQTFYLKYALDTID